MKSLNEYYDHHPNDSRVTGPHTIANSVCARYGTGGGNTPLVLHSEPKERGETVGGESSESDNRPKSGYKESDIRGRTCEDITFSEEQKHRIRESGVQRSEPVQSRQYYMTDKAGHMCRWKLLDKAMTLQASDYKDPPAILAPGR